MVQPWVEAQENDAGRLAPFVNFREQTRWPPTQRPLPPNLFHIGLFCRRHKAFCYAVTGGAEKDLVGYKGSKAKNHDCDYKFVSPAFFLGLRGLIRIVRHGKFLDQAIPG